MSISSVQQKIKTAMTVEGCDGAHISAQEMKGITKDAEKDRVVSPGEAQKIADLVEKGRPFVERPPGSIRTLACPEHGASSFTIDKGAIKDADAMFARNALPYGRNEEVIRGKVTQTLGDIGHSYGPQIKKPSLRGLHPLTVADQRLVDGPLTEAYLDTKKNRMFLKVTGSGMAGPETVGPYWFGPINIDLKQKEVTPAFTKKLVKAAQAALENIEFGGGLPLGSRMVRVPLFAERHPDGFSYAALVPVGALAPGAPASDPNKAKHFFLERSGGFSGLTEVGGPISV